MVVLEFKASEVARIVRHALTAPEHRSAYGQEENPGPQLWLVGDQGVYLMSNGSPADDTGETNTKLFVSYAKGCNPEADDFDTWYNNKVDWFGGDDGCDALDWCETIGQQLIAGAKTIRIGITANNMKLLDPK